MAIYRKGGDPEAMAAAATRMAGYADQVRSVSGIVDGAVVRLAAGWGGQDLDRFARQWGQSRPQVDAMAQALRAMSDALTRNANAQTDTSAGGGSIPLGPPPWGGGPGGGPGGGGPSGGDGGWDGRPPWWLDGVYHGLYDATAIQAAGLNALGLAMNWEKGAGLLANLKAYAALPDNAAMMGADLFSGTNWAEVLGGGLSTEGSPGLARTVGVVGELGKAFGWAGVGISAWNTYTDFKDGNNARGSYDIVMTGLGAAALVTPPPVNIVCGGAAAVMGVSQLLYDHVPAVHDFVDGSVAAIGQGLSDVGHALSSVWPF